MGKGTIQGSEIFQLHAEKSQQFRAAELGYMQAAGVVTNCLNSGVPLV